MKNVRKRTFGIKKKSEKFFGYFYLPINIYYSNDFNL